MEDKKPQRPQKRRYCSSDVPSKRRLLEIPPAQEKPPQSAPRRVVLPHTSSDQLLDFLGLFLQQRCYRLKLVSSLQPKSWIKKLDYDLLTQGYQRQSFISSGSVVFLHMLCRDLISPHLNTIEELKASLFTCFYISCSYIGNEISYPFMPFLLGSSQKEFFDRCLSYVRRMSPKMMKINSDRQYYFTVLAELKAVGTLNL